MSLLSRLQPQLQHLGSTPGMRGSGSSESESKGSTSCRDEGDRWNRDEVMGECGTKLGQILDFLGERCGVSITDAGRTRMDLPAVKWKAEQSSVWVVSSSSSTLYVASGTR